MIRSHPILLEGHIVGIVVTAAPGVRFTALDPRLDDLQGAAFPDAAEARRVAALVLARETGRGLPRAA